MGISMKSAIISVFLLFNLTALMAQTKEYQPVNFGLDTKNMHLWRGYKVTNNAMTALNASYSTRNGKFTAGLWNGVSFDGSYTEFDYYMSYTFSPKWSLSIWDINNFSDFPDANIFNYNNATTSHFVDVTLAFQPSSRFSMSWSSIVLGRDTFVNQNDEVQNAYSNYVQANMLAFEGKEVQVSLFVGGAFSLRNEAHFYGHKAGIVNTGLGLSKEVDILGTLIPVSAMAMWNPLLQHGAMQIQIGLF